MTQRRAPIIAGIIGVTVLALIAVLAMSFGDKKEEAAGIVGSVAPELEGETLKGPTVTIDQFKGQWVLVNFFATWCPPCVVEHPELVEFAKRNAGQVQVVSVAFDDTEVDKVRTFFEENGGDWPVLVDGGGGASLDFGVKKLPESFLIDPAGNVAVKINGGVTVEQLEQLIAERTAGSANEPEPGS